MRKIAKLHFFHPQFPKFPGAFPWVPRSKIELLFQATSRSMFSGRNQKAALWPRSITPPWPQDFFRFQTFSKSASLQFTFSSWVLFFCQVASSRATALAWARTSLQSASNFFTVDISLSKLFSAMFSKSRFFTVSRAASSSTFLVFSCPRSALPQMITSPKEDPFFYEYHIYLVYTIHWLYWIVGASV